MIVQSMLALGRTLQRAGLDARVRVVLVVEESHEATLLDAAIREECDALLPVLRNRTGLRAVMDIVGIPVEIRHETVGHAEVVTT